MTRNVAPVLVCTGNLTLDETWSPEATAPVESVGGDALFASLAARLAGARPHLLAPLGDDASPDLLEALRVAGASPHHLPRRAAPTVRNVVRYAADGTREWLLLHGEEHFELLSVHPEDVPAALLAADGVLLSAMALKAQLQLAAWWPAHSGSTVYFDPQEDYVAGHERELRTAVAACDVFLPSEVEARAVSGTDDLLAAARHLLALGPDVVVVKLAERGCLVATAEHPAPVHVAADVVAPVDSTGAGDAFCGAFAAEHLQSNDPLAAAREGSRVARLAVGGHGADALLAAVTRDLESVR